MSRQSRPQLSTLYFVVAISILALGIPASGYFYYTYQEEQIQHGSKQQLSAIADLKADQIKAWQQERLSDGAFFNSSELFASLAREVLRSPSHVRLKNSLRKELVRVVQSHDYKCIQLFDLNGKEILRVGDASGNPEPLTGELTRSAFESRSPQLSDFHLGDSTSGIHSDMLVPLFSRGERDTIPLGIVLFRIDPEIYLFPLISLWPTPSRTGECGLVRRDGEGVVYLNELRLRHNPPLAFRRSIQDSLLPAAMAARGEEGAVEGVDYRGIPVLAALRPIPGTPWSLVAKIDLEEVNAPVRQQAWHVVALVAALLLAGVVPITSLWNRLRAEHLRTRTRAAESFRESEEKFRELTENLRDPWVSVDMNGNIREFNADYARMVGYEPAELRKLNYEDITPEEWHAFEAKLITEQVLSRGYSDIYEKEYRKQDGTVIPVELRAILMRDSERRPEGMWAIVRDISERQRAQKAIQLSEEHYRTLVEQASDGIFIADVNGRYIDVNSSVCAMLGYTRAEILAKSISDFIPSDDLVAHPLRINELRQGETLLTQRQLFRKDGTVVAVEINARMLSDGRFQGIQRDITERTRAQVALSESEGRFKLLFDDAPVGYHEIDVQGRVVEVNRTELAMLGYTANEMLFHPAWDFIVEREDARKAIMAKFARSIPSDRSHERTMLRKDGTTLMVLLTDRALLNAAGDIIGIRSTVQDITERNNAERELKLMAQTVASAQDCISITDLENKLLFLNDSFQLTYGYTPEELLGKDVSVLRSPHAPSTMTETIYTDTLGGGWHGEVLNRRKDGSDFPVELWTSVVKDEAGIPVAMVGVARNITDRKLAAERLRQNDEQFRLITENVEDMIAVLDLNGKRIYSSPSYASILQDPESLQGTEGFQEAHADDRERIKKVFQEIARTGIGQRFEFRLVSKDGSERHIESKGSVIRDSDGRISRTILVSRDVTEEKKLAAQFLRAQRMESIGTLAGGIAHDLNNVLAPIMMAIELLRTKLSDPRGQGILDAIESSAQRGSDIVKQVLAFGRGVEGERIQVQLKHVINEVVKIAGQTFSKSIDIKTEIPRDLWTVSADPTQMHQVFLNILVNARDAMPRRGTLSIAAENFNVDDKYSRLHLDAKPGAYVSISISDTGTGIPANIREKIFEPFFTTKEIGMGTGLGLSTTLAIVKSHGGFINLYSEMGKGTRFNIFIPATGTSSRKTAVDAEADLPTGNGEMILIIDDESAIREITRETLQAYGYRALTAADGAEGVAIFAEHQKNIAVVITDIMMPIMDGTAAIAELQRIKPDVKIIAASGLTTQGQITTPSGPGVQAFLTKPYTAEKLLKALAKVLR